MNKDTNLSKKIGMFVRKLDEAVNIKGKTKRERKITKFTLKFDCHKDYIVFNESEHNI